MNVKSFAIGCGGIILALLAFFIYRLANPWETMRSSGYEVQRNRITEMVRLRVGDTWQDSLNDAPYADPLSPNDVARVKLSDLAFVGTRGYFCGKATVIGKKPLQGRLAIMITVKNRLDGKRRVIESERSLRCNVDWSAGTPHPFVLNTGMTVPSSVEKFTAVVVPVTAVGE